MSLILTDETSPKILAEVLLEMGTIASHHRERKEEAYEQLKHSEERLKESRDLVSKQTHVIDTLRKELGDVRNSANHFHKSNEEARMFIKYLIENVKLPRRDLYKAKSILK